MAYLAPRPEHNQLLGQLRVAIRDARRVATTCGYGPRFLHSTGQLHKGGPPQGVFLQITADAPLHIEIPASGYTYQTLIHAQALGDLQSLQQHGRPALRLHLPDESADSLQKVLDLVNRALAVATSPVG
jgi:transaldolase / glucose-6-phosphate isomerase